MKMERGLPILEGVELNKYKSLAKTVVSTGSNIESKITPLRKKRMTRKRRPYVKLLTHGWKIPRKSCRPGSSPTLWKR